MNTPQPNMEYKDIVDKFPDTIKIYPHHIIQVMIEKGIGDFDPSKTWLQMGLDDLDIIELIMELEKMLDIVIPDDMAEVVFNENSTPQIFISGHREYQLSRLFNDQKNS